MGAELITIRFIKGMISFMNNGCAVDQWLGTGMRVGQRRHQVRPGTDAIDVICWNNLHE